MDKLSTINHQPSTELEFSHFIVDREGVIFASARDESNKVYNFIINQLTGGVLEQVNSHFEPIERERAETIRKDAQHWYGILPTYRIPHFDFS
ncbi:MAG: hypothetical protein KJ711_05245 [Candidatus Omnitrophica bacterium]|nr:hypothetical protein [Candidatus Omnitrophota bacterium]